MEENPENPQILTEILARIQIIDSRSLLGNISPEEPTFSMETYPNAPLQDSMNFKFYQK